MEAEFVAEKTKKPREFARAEAHQYHHHPGTSAGS
jgi:hypothetical protein